MSPGYIVQSILIIIFASLFIRQYAIYEQTNSANNIMIGYRVIIGLLGTNI